MCGSDKELIENLRGNNISRRDFVLNSSYSVISALILSGCTSKSIASNSEKTIKHSHEYFMSHAIMMAKMSPEYPFGAVIVDRKTNEIVATGHNKNMQNPVLHGEIDAINNYAAVKRKHLANTV